MAKRIEEKDVSQAVRSFKKMSPKSRKIIVAVLVIAIIAGALYGTVFYKKIDTPVIDAGALGTGLIAWELGELQVHFIDVGAGDAIVIRLPDDKLMMIDGGDRGKEKDILPYLEDRIAVDYFDYMMLTHSDADHCGSLDNILDEYEVHNIYMPDLRASDGMPNEDEVMGAIGTGTYKDFYDKAMSEQYNIDGVTYDTEIFYNVDTDNTIEINELTIVDEEAGYRIDIYCVEADVYDEISEGSSGNDKNMVSPIIVLTYAGKTVVFTGDAIGETESMFIEAVGDSVDCDVLKVAHHGSNTHGTSSQEFLDAIKPEYGIISCGDKHGHPSPEVIERLAGLNGYKDTYITKEHGDIMLSISKTGEMDFKVEKEVA